MHAPNVAGGTTLSFATAREAFWCTGHTISKGMLCRASTTLACQGCSSADLIQHFAQGILVAKAGLSDKLLQGALDSKQQRAGSHKKRRHDTDEEVHGAEGRRRGEGEATGSRERWGHDKFEEEYGEPRSKGSSKKRSLRP